jgi:PAS domain S-box-containing protein
MLGKLSDQIRACHERAVEARRKAEEATPDSRLKADYLEIEKTWLILARSYAFTESLTAFIAGSRAEQGEPQRSRFDPKGDQILKLPVGELFDLLPVALYVCEPGGLIVYYNRRAAKLWGRSPKLLDAADRFCGSHRMYHLDGDPLPHPECPMAELLRTGLSVSDREIIIERPDGSRGVALVNIEALRDGSGKILGAVNCFQEVTDRKRQEEAVQRLASIVESSDDAIVSKSLDGIITSWNKGAERVFGYTAEEATGKPITIVIPPDRHDEERIILERIRHGERIDHFETVRQRKDGSLIVVSLTVSPLKDAQGKIVGASKIAKDITERKRSEEQIATLAREAEHRTKNVLATVQATVMLSQSDTPDGLKQVIQGRILALAKVHALFVESRWVGEPSCPVSRCKSFRRISKMANHEFGLTAQQLLLEPTKAQAITMTLHELATNAAKYGALSVSTGRVEVNWSLARDGRLAMRWIERGGVPVETPSRRGFGTHVMRHIITNQLGGEMHLDWRTEGLVCEVILPI